ncbi:MAG TPA: hypothetical protein PLL20_03810 [Phycisphaerae bacterium]|nr:hypothetical protein [Phycisphaerae bacterium]HRR83832.1 hypothetical protein [Phycisphaerae bacterium]
MLRDIRIQLKAHVPFTAFGTATGIAIMALIVWTGVSQSTSSALFWTFHPIHVFLSALATAAMYRLHSGGKLLAIVLVGYVGSIGIATLSDSVIPYVGEYLLGLPNRGVHFGFIEKWWLVNPLALLGIAVARLWPQTKFTHSGHVLLSTWASLFHMTMALGDNVTALTWALLPVFLFLAVWVPCCTSDIVFPLILARRRLPVDAPREQSEEAYRTS